MKQTKKTYSIMKKTFKTLVFAIAGLLALASCEDVPAPYSVPDKNSNTGGNAGGTVEPQGDGTMASPFNVAAVVAKIKEMPAGVESTEEYYIKGKVLAVTTTSETITQYGNHTFTMIDEGDNSTVFTAFQVYGPGKKKFTSVDDIKVGDEVVVCGKVVNFKGNTPETVGKGAAYVVSINAAGGGDGGGGSTPSTSSKDKPLTVSQAKSASGNNYVKGYIVGYVDGQKLEDGATFGVPANAETEILLAETPDETNTDNVIPVQLPVGDIRSALELSAHPDYLKKEVLLYGSLETYFGVPGMKETSWASIDGKTYGKDPEGGSGDIPSGEAKGSGTEADPYNAIAAIQYAKSLGADVESANDVYVTGVISSIKYTYSSDFGTATYSISDDGKAENEFTVYGSYYLNNQPWKDGDTQIEKGDVVVVCGKVVNYRGNTPEFVNKKNWLVSINKSGDGGDTPEPPTPGPGGDVVTDLVNGDFESWVSDTEPTGWKSASTASNAEVSKSVDARNGSFACKVGAPGTQNKRLATQEITLEAGSYTFSYYAKSTTTNVCQSRAGYVPVTNGSVGAYKYGGYVDINNSEWTLVSYDFELTSTTTLCLFASNPKETAGKTISQDILIDDATLVKKQ